MKLKKILFLFLILISISLISAQNIGCSTGGGGCTILLSESAQTPLLKDKVYTISVLAISSDSAILKINNEEKIVLNPGSNINGFFQNNNSFDVDNMRIKYVQVYFNHPVYPNGAIRLGYTAVTPYCIDSDVDENYPDGKNYYKEGYLLYAGYPNITDGIDQYASRDSYMGQDNMGQDVIEEKYCDPVNGPQRMNFKCPNGKTSIAYGTLSCKPLPAPCVESWSCIDWSDCIINKRIRTCIDLNNCGTTNNKNHTEEECLIPSNNSINNSSKIKEDTQDLSKCINGCILEDSCVGTGYRINDTYCDLKNVFTQQIKSGESCENNFECSSNVCSSKKCISLSLIERILEWLGKLFGEK